MCCASVFDWAARFRRTKGAVKLHLLLDHDGFLPCYAVITEGKQHEIGVARQLRYEPGTLLAIDRGYLDYGWFAELSQQGMYFVTRMKDNADYLVVEERELPQRKGLLRDQPQGRLQFATMYPLLKSPMASLIRRILGGQFAPLRARTEHPQHAVQHMACIPPWTPPPIRPVTGTQDRLQ
jgi:hypothetical protein